MTMHSDALQSAPNISVVMPVYNGARYLLSSVRSVVAQTVEPLELIIVDDGSTDCPEEVVRGIEAPFPIKVIRQENRGQSAARNEGVRLASGEFVAFLDQDDAWRSRHLELLAQPFEGDAQLGWVYSDFDEMDTDGRTVTRQFMADRKLSHPKRTLGACLGEDLMVLPSASLIRTAAYLEVGGFDEALSGYEDDDLFVRVFRADWGHEFVPLSLTRFRIHATSSSTDASFLRSRMLYLEKLRQTVPDDHRLNRYYMRDLVIPRFFLATLCEYACAMHDGNVDRALALADIVEQISSMQGPAGFRRRAEMTLMRKPLMMREILRRIDRIPAPIRPHVNKVLRNGNDVAMRSLRMLR
jgi:glycosyltransferase involved in cell wall biosynthesis